MGQIQGNDKNTHFQKLASPQYTFATSTQHTQGILRYLIISSPLPLKYMFFYPEHILFALLQQQPDN